MTIGAKIASGIKKNSLDSILSEHFNSRSDIQFKFSEINVHEIFLRLHKLKTLIIFRARALKITA